MNQSDSPSTCVVILCNECFLSVHFDAAHGTANYACGVRADALPARLKRLHRSFPIFLVLHILAHPIRTALTYLHPEMSASMRVGGNILMKGRVIRVCNSVLIKFIKSHQVKIRWSKSTQHGMYHVSL